MSEKDLIKTVSRQNSFQDWLRTVRELPIAFYLHSQPVADHYPHVSCTVHVLLVISSYVQNLYIQAYSEFKWKSFFLQPINHSILLSVTIILSLFKKINTLSIGASSTLKLHSEINRSNTLDSIVAFIKRPVAFNKILKQKCMTHFDDILL